MSTVTGFQAMMPDGTAVLTDAHGNNAAFACSQCRMPILAVLREHQRGSSPTHPATCIRCSARFWLEVNGERQSLLVHEIPPLETENSSFPKVIGRPTKDAGRYRLGSTPGNFAPHNQASWRIIAAILEAYGTADYYDLAVAVRQHQHGDKSASGPQSFVSYCVSNGWLRRA